MTVPSRTASRPHRLICPLCESGELLLFGPGFARCESCGLPLLGSALETLRDVIGLPDALGAHPCECGHPEMRVLPDGVFHCPACRSEILPFKARGWHLDKTRSLYRRKGLPPRAAGGGWSRCLAVPP